MFVLTLIFIYKKEPFGS